MSALPMLPTSTTRASTTISISDTIATPVTTSASTTCTSGSVLASTAVLHYLQTTPQALAASTTSTTTATVSPVCTTLVLPDITQARGYFAKPEPQRNKKQPKESKGVQASPGCAVKSVQCELIKPALCDTKTTRYNLPLASINKPVDTAVTSATLDCLPSLPASEEDCEETADLSHNDDDCDDIPVIVSSTEKEAMSSDGGVRRMGVSSSHRDKMESQDSPVMSDTEVKMETGADEIIPLDRTRQKTACNTADRAGNTGGAQPKATPSHTASTTVDTDRDVKPLPLTEPLKEWREPSTSTSTAHGGDQADADQTTVLQTAVNNITGTPSSLDSPYVCQHCSAAFGQLSSLRLHITLVHIKPAPSVLSVSSGPDTSHGRRDEGTHRNHADKVAQFSCDVCSETFTKAGHLRKHKTIHAVSKRFDCGVCDRAFPCAGDLKKHVTGTGHKPFVCETCGKAFKNLCHLNVHVRIHTNHRPFVCDVCSKAFTTATHLNTHKKLHTGHKPFVCDVCSKAFSQLSSLKEHYMRHTGLKPFACDLCSKTFPKSRYLMIHMRGHTGYKPFLCDVCSKAFTQSSSLKEHMTIHTGHKPFKCDVCGKAFPRSSSLKTHMKIHTGDKPFICDVCGKAFGVRSKLKRHMTIHTGHKPL